MLFKNNGESIKIRIGNIHNCYWVTVRHDKVIDLPEKLGLDYGFEKINSSIKTTEGQLGSKKVQTKQIETDKQTDKISEVYFFDKLIAINGIGTKTAKDIVKLYGVEEDLIDAIKNGDGLPLRDDIEEKLRRKYG